LVGSLVLSVIWLVCW